MRGDEGLLTDYIDGRMPPAEKTAFDERLAAEPALARRLRLLLAMRASLKAGAKAMPADLKAALKREARARSAKKSRPSWRELWRSTFGSGLGCGLGAAFAAALLTLGARWALPRRPALPAARPAPAAWTDAAATDGLKSLWVDDDGRDRDHEG